MSHMGHSKQRAVAQAASYDEPWPELDGPRDVLTDAVYRADPLTRIAWVRDGLPADVLPAMSVAMAVPRETLYATLGLARATVSRKLQAGQRLNPDESERVLGLLRLVGQTDALVAESGRPDGFDAARWVAKWLERPVPALGGVRPADLMDTGEGRALVANLLACMQSGAYA